MYNKYTRKSNSIFVNFLHNYWVWILTGVLCLIMFNGCQSTTRESHTITISDTYVRNKGKTSHKMVVDTDGNTYSVDDQILGDMVFNSGDTYAKLINNKGKTVCITTYGIRNPTLSFFQNITDVKDGSCE